MSTEASPTITSPVRSHHNTMDDPTSPMLMHDQPPSPREGPPRDRHDIPPSYGPPPFGGYPYPPYPPASYGGPPPLGGYYSYGPPPYGGYGPPPYGYGYHSPYPSQHPNKAPPVSSDSKRRKSPGRRADPRDKKLSMCTNVAEDIELERMRAASDPAQVKPMRTEFHFFVDDMRDTVQKEAEKELGEHASNKFLLNSNMNARLMKLWEDASEETRAEYFAKEEDDRRRFMADDEIASRHCATLTARAKNPGGKEGDDDYDEDDEDDSESDESLEKRKSPQKSVTSPPKKAKLEIGDASKRE